jgi:undecaprenyl phosphate N,N'-diacetylbacillosamine 1-phosphate transferase
MMKVTFLNNNISNNNITNIVIKKPEGAYFSIIKPSLDILAAIILLVITLPIWLIISLFIKLDSPGPIIFKQVRIGKDGKEFLIYKFRTMYQDVPSQGRSPISDDDPRITRVGKFLRKTSLDELPQLINIIKGEMSFVGPRPEQKLIVDKYYTNYEKQRFLVKPGITGLWQISLDRTKPIHENLQYDFTYINNVSLFMDLKILFKTIIIMFRSNTF